MVFTKSLVLSENRRTEDELANRVYWRYVSTSLDGVDVKVGDN